MNLQCYYPWSVTVSGLLMVQCSWNACVLRPLDVSYYVIRSRTGEQMGCVLSLYIPEHIYEYAYIYMYSDSKQSRSKREKGTFWKTDFKLIHHDTINTIGFKLRFSFFFSFFFMFLYKNSTTRRSWVAVLGIEIFLIENLFYMAYTLKRIFFDFSISFLKRKDKIDILLVYTEYDL